MEESRAATPSQRRWQAVVRVLRSPAHIATQLTNDIVTTLFPADCECCQEPLLRAHAVPVCDACLARVTASELFSCRRCGEAIHFDLDLDLEAMRLAEDFFCRACRLAPPAFTRAVAYGVYDDELRTLIHLLKYRGVPGVANLLGSRLGKAVLSLEAVAAASMLVVAVPLFPARQRVRGYNQSVLLAEAAIQWLKRSRPTWTLTPAHSVLRRVRRTESQYVLSPKGRRRNLKGAFQVAGDVDGREVLLVDDIFTSGATARECSRVLLAAGAAKVWVATVARAQKRHLRRQHEQPEELVAIWDMKHVVTHEAVRTSCTH